MPDERSDCEKILLVILALILPPVTAFIQDGCGVHFWINIILTLLGWLPGFIHAAWLVVRTPPEEGGL